MKHESKKILVDILSKKNDIVKNKLFVHSAGVAGCWTFLSGNYEKLDILVIVTAMLIFIFGFGVSSNIIQMNNILEELSKIEKEIKNG